MGKALTLIEDIELSSWLPEAPAESENEVTISVEDHKKPAHPEKINLLEELNETYSSESTDGLLSEITEDFELNIADLMVLCGPWLAPAMWIGLKLCPEDLRQRILSTLSPIRNAVNSIRTLNRTAEMTGLPVLQNPIVNGIGSGAGLAAAMTMSLYILPEIQILEDNLRRRTKLNRLLAQHLEKHTQVPSGLSQIQMIQWLEDDTHSQFSDLPLRDVTEQDFEEYNVKESNRLTFLKLIVEILNSFYSVSVADTNLNLSSVSNLFSHPAALSLNLAVGAVLVVNYYRMATHETEGILLETQQSYLTGKRQWMDSQLQSIPADTGSEIKARQETVAKQLQVCEQKIVIHKTVNFRKTLLVNAAFKGFQEGAETVGLITGIPVSVLVLAHVVSLSFPPLYFAILGLTIASGLYFGYKFYQQKKRQLDKECSEPPKVANISQFLSKPCVPEASPLLLETDSAQCAMGNSH